MKGLSLNLQPLNKKTNWHSKVRRWHKWLSLIVGIQVVIWVLSGLFMVSVSIDNIHGDQFVAAPQPISTVALASVPKKYVSAKSVLLTQQLSKPVYIIDNNVIINAQTGQEISITRQYIKQRAIESLSSKSAITSIKKLTQYPEELGGRHREIWRVDFNATFNPTLYFSPTNGRLVSKRSDLWRVYDFLWSLHIMDYEHGEDSHNTLLFIASALAFLMACCGLWLMFYALKLKAPVGKVGVLTNIHRWLALLVSLQLLLWVIGGLAFNLMSSDKIKSTITLNKTPTLSFSPQLIDFNLILAKYSTITQISIRATSNDPLIYISNNQKMTPLSLSLTDKPLLKIHIKNIALQAITTQVAIKSITLMDSTHTESRKFKRLVWQVLLDNDNDSALYIDAYNGRVLKILENGWRIKDFFWMLHIMDYQDRSNFNHPLIIIAAGLAAMASLTGFILLLISFKRKKRINVPTIVTVKITNLDNHDNQVDVKPNQSLLHALIDTDKALPSGCGGKGTCGQCRVKIDDYQRPLNTQETVTLNEQERTQGYRLACQCVIERDLTISLPSVATSSSKSSATVISSQFKTPFIKELTLKLNDNITSTFQSGQYINIHLPPLSINFKHCIIPPQFQKPWQLINKEQFQVTSLNSSQRSYSLASASSHDGFITLNVKIALPNHGNTIGLGSSYLFNINVGESLEFTGPFGNFIIDDASTKEVILIGAGSGIAPLKSLAEQAIKRQKRRVSLWYGVRELTDIIHQSYFDNLSKQHKNFQWRLSLSRPETDDWQGLTGYVQHHLITGYLSKHKAINNIDFYLCGPHSMMDETQHLLTKLGVRASQIKRDSFG